MKNKEVKGTVLVFLTAIISGFSIFANKIFVATIDPLIFTALRALFIGVIFFFLSAIYASSKGQKHFKKVSWGYLVSIGVIGGGFAFWLFFQGLKLTTSSRAGFIHKTLPLYAIILAFLFLNEKITRKQAISTLTMFAGLFILLLSSIQPSQFWSNPGLGDLLVLSATILWGIENTIAKKVLIQGENNFVVSFSRMFFGALILFAVIILTNKFNLLFELNFEQWLRIIVSTVILFGYILTYYWGLKYINLSKAATILIIAPVITLILGVTFLGEPAPAMQLLGSTIILIGAYFLSTVKSEYQKAI